MALNEHESKALAEGIQNVSKYYDVPVSAKTQAWVMLAITAGGIYGSKIDAIMQRRKKERETAPVENHPNLSLVS